MNWDRLHLCIFCDSNRQQFHHNTFGWRNPSTQAYQMFELGSKIHKNSKTLRWRLICFWFFARPSLMLLQFIESSINLSPWKFFAQIFSCSFRCQGAKRKANWKSRQQQQQQTNERENERTNKNWIKHKMEKNSTICNTFYGKGSRDNKN